MAYQSTECKKITIDPVEYGERADELLKEMKAKAQECGDLLGEIESSPNSVKIRKDEECGYDYETGDPCFTLGTAVCRSNWKQAIAELRDLAKQIGPQARSILADTLMKGVRPVMLSKKAWWSTIPFEDFDPKISQTRTVPKDEKLHPAIRTIDTSKRHELAEILLYYVSDPQAKIESEDEEIFTESQELDPSSSIWHRILIWHEDKLRPGPGTNAVVKFPFDSKTDFSDDKPPWILLAHELVHCYHIVSGRYYLNNVLEEARTTGLPPWDHRNDKYTENRFRKRAGLKERKYYRDHNAMGDEPKFGAFYRP